ncbi:MAG TPA: T9SS type A sorting domain-containing protein [Phaeodactylibacter sp.]|nr:T9SS type A sorting domain-containing protein [Phaeodactylibacter sp.]
MNLKSFLTILLALFCWIGINAQTKFKSTSVTKKVEDAKVQVSYAKFIGKTKKLRDLIPLRPMSKEKKAAYKKNRKKPVNFIGRKKTIPVNPSAISPDPDPIRQTEMDLNKTPAFVVEPIVNVDGITAGSPNDPTGDVGLNNYVQAVNATSFAIFDKEGNNLSGAISANTLWNSIGFASAGDPIVLYDQEVNRWIITEFPSGNQLLFAISETSDPTGAWLAYNFATPNFPDYPKYAVWNNSYVVTTNEQGSGVFPAYFINREDILNGATSPMIQRLEMPGVPGGPSFFVSTPVDWSGALPPASNPMILGLNDDVWGSSATDQIDIFSTEIDWANPNNTQVTTTSVTLASFNTAACAAPGVGFACIPQMGGGGIDGIPEIPMFQPHYRNFGTHESLVFNFLVNANTPSDIIAGIRWVELRKQGGGDWTLYQEGTYAPDDGLHRFMGAIAMDGNGNIGLAFNVSSPDIFPGLRFTGRRASDPLGEMTIEEYSLIEGASTNTSSRWGDYAHMTIDPTNDRTFWFTGEYRGANMTNTRIAAFELRKDTTDIGVSALNTPQSSLDLTATETIQIEVKNFGLDTQMVYNVGYIFENGTTITEPVSMQLLPDSIYTHTFTPTVDMSVVGDYHLKLFTALATDDAILNDTLRTIVSKFSRYDAGMTNITGLENIICGDSTDIELAFTNFGADTLTAVSIEVSLNGTLITTIPWTGSLPTGETASIPVSIGNLPNGSNEIIATTSNPNGQTDEIMSNDSVTRTASVTLNGELFSLIINLDEYPEETIWQLTDADGVIFFEGGPYPGQDLQEVTESWCIAPDKCFTLTVFDAYGDGICCDFGEGNYSVVNEVGDTVIASTGDFGVSETNDFCGSGGCMLTADIDVSPEMSAGASDGVIMISASNGAGPFMYSIDGGTTYQASNVFTGLAGGDYNIVVMATVECLYETTANVPTCALSVTATVVNEISGVSPGSIEINAVNGIGTLEYSIDDGVTYLSTPLFENLAASNYLVHVRDSAGCEITLLVVVDMETSTNNVIFGTSIEVLPNPTNGLFRINVTGLQRGDVFLPFYIYDVSGKLVQYSQLVKYDDTYTSEVSLVAYPAGTYFIRFLDENMNRLVKVVKN